MQSVHRACMRLVYFWGSEGECDWGSLLASIKHHKAPICNAKESEQGWGGGSKNERKKVSHPKIFRHFWMPGIWVQVKKEADKNPKHVPPAGRRRTGLRSTLSSHGSERGGSIPA